MRYGIIRKDIAKVRGTDPNVAYPATSEFLRSPTSTKHPDKRLSVAVFQRHLHMHNYLEGVGRLQKAIWAGGYWVNKRADPTQQYDAHELLALPEDSDEEMPQVVFVGCDGNLVEIVEERNGAYRIAALDPNQVPAETVNWRDNPTLVTKFTGLRPADGAYVNASFGAPGQPADDLYHFNFAPGAEAWILKNKIEPFPAMSEERVVSATNVRSAPRASATRLDTWQPGRVFTVRDYHLEGANVWAETDYGYLILRYLPYPGFNTYWQPTTWQLESDPVLEPLDYPDPPDPTSPTNQDIINAFWRAFGWTYWAKMLQAYGAAYPVYMAQNRGAAYTGIYLYQMALSDADKQKLQIELLR